MELFLPPPVCVQKHSQKQQEQMFCFLEKTLILLRPRVDLVMILREALQIGSFDFPLVFLKILNTCGFDRNDFEYTTYYK